MLKDKNIENLRFAVYGGICGVLGVLSIILLLFSNLDCKSDNLFIIGINIISSFLGALTIFFGYKAIKHIQGKSIMTLGIIIIVVAWSLYSQNITCI